MLDGSWTVLRETAKFAQTELGKMPADDDDEKASCLKL